MQQFLVKLMYAIILNLHFFFIVVIIIIWPNFISAVEFEGFGLWLDSPIRYKQVS
jgi:hypothetical protein